MPVISGMSRSHQDHVERSPCSRSERACLARVCNDDVVFLVEDASGRLSEKRLVVDDQHTRPAASGAAGFVTGGADPPAPMRGRTSSSTRKVVPFPGTLSTPIVPPSRVTDAVADR